MQRPATWKVLTLGAALTSLGFIGAGTAMAQTDAIRESAGIDTAPEVMSDLLDRFKTASPDDMAARAPATISVESAGPWMAGAISDLPDRFKFASPDFAERILFPF